MNLVKMLLKGLDAYKREQEKHFDCVLASYFDSIEGYATNNETVKRIQDSRERRLKEIDATKKWVSTCARFIQNLKDGIY